MHVSVFVDGKVLVWSVEKEGFNSLIGKFRKETDAMQIQWAICTWVITLHAIKDVHNDRIQTIIQLHVHFQTKIKVKTHIYWIPHSDRVNKWWCHFQRSSLTIQMHVRRQFINRQTIDSNLCKLFGIVSKEYLNRKYRRRNRRGYFQN